MKYLDGDVAIDIVKRELDAANGLKAATGRDVRYVLADPAEFYHALISVRAFCDRAIEFIDAQHRDPLPPDP